MEKETKSPESRFFPACFLYTPQSHGPGDIYMEGATVQWDLRHLFLFMLSEIKLRGFFYLIKSQMAKVIIDLEI